jgi:hypothetical protein
VAGKTALRLKVDRCVLEDFINSFAWRLRNLRQTRCRNGSLAKCRIATFWLDIKQKAVRRQLDPQ